MHKPIYSWVLAASLGLAQPALAVGPEDRDQLTSMLTLDDQVLLEAAEAKGTTGGVVEALRAEIEATARLVAALDERRASALRRSLDRAARAELLPLDIDTDALQRILDEDLVPGEIEQLAYAYVLQARFERVAGRFDARGEGFEEHAARARRKGLDSRRRLLCQIGVGVAVTVRDEDEDTTGQGCSDAAEPLQLTRSGAEVPE